MLFENSTVGELAKGRSRKELDAFKDGVLYEMKECWRIAGELEEFIEVTIEG